MSDNIEATILQTLASTGTVEDTGDLAKKLNVDHLVVVGMMKSLEAAEMIAVKVNMYHVNVTM